ncbi:MAG TPA: hypothetical protein VGD78_14375 [Chthoniobacterales bacterium]
MTDQTSRRPASFRTYLGLTCLLGAAIVFSRLPLGPLRVLLVLLASSAQGWFMVVSFMRVRWQSHLIWLAAGAGLLWLGILFSLTFTDYLSRAWTW